MTLLNVFTPVKKIERDFNILITYLEIFLPDLNYVYVALEGAIAIIIKNIHLLCKLIYFNSIIKHHSLFYHLKSLKLTSKLPCDESGMPFIHCKEF